MFLVKLTFTDGLSETYEGVHKIEFNGPDSWLDLNDEDGKTLHSFDLNDIKNIEVANMSKEV